MEEFLAIVKIILGGGLPATVVLLLGIIAYLVWDRRNTQRIHHEMLKELAETLSEKFDKDTDQLIRIIDQYHQGQIGIVQALNEIKLLLTSISTRQ